MILIGSIYIKDKNYHPEVFLEKYKHVVTDNVEIYSDDSDQKTEIKKVKYINYF